jgi:Domain of unknown function (DUF4129)
VSTRPAARGSRRATVVAAVLLAALLVLVALASRGRLGGEEPAGASLRPALPPGAFAYLYAGLLVLAAVALPFFFYVYARETPYSRARRRRARLAPFVLVAFVAVGLLVATRWGADIRAALAELQVWSGIEPDGPYASRGATPPTPEWTATVVVSSTLALAAGGLVAWRFARRRLRRPTLAETLSGVLDRTLDDLREERDARRAIILAYAQMETALDRSGVPRRESEAPFEYVSRVLIELDVTEEPVRALTDLFEQAKFSRHAIDAAMKEHAIEALATIRAELHELA